MRITLSSLMITLASLATVSAIAGTITGNNRYLSASLVSGNLTGLLYQVKYHQDTKKVNSDLDHSYEEMSGS